MILFDIVYALVAIAAIGSVILLPVLVAWARDLPDLHILLVGLGILFAPLVGWIVGLLFASVAEPDPNKG